MDTWPHLLSTCTNRNIKGLCITCHNNFLHHIIHTLQSNKHTILLLYLVNVGTHQDKTQMIVIMEWIPNCICTATCTCMAWLWPDLLSIIGTPSTPPVAPPPSQLSNWFKFTYCHNKYNLFLQNLDKMVERLTNHCCCGHERSHPQKLNQSSKTPQGYPP